MNEHEALWQSLKVRDSETMKHGRDAQSVGSAESNIPPSQGRRSRAERKRLRKEQLDESMWTPLRLDDSASRQEPQNIKPRTIEEHSLDSAFARSRSASVILSNTTFSELRTDATVKESAHIQGASKMLRLSGIPRSLTQKDLKRAMQRFAPIKSLQAAGPTAYVEFSSADGAQTALNCASANKGLVNIKGDISVVLARPPPELMDSQGLSHQTWFNSTIEQTSSSALHTLPSSSAPPPLTNVYNNGADYTTKYAPYDQPLQPKLQFDQDNPKLQAGSCGEENMLSKSYSSITKGSPNEMVLAQAPPIRLELAKNTAVGRLNRKKGALASDHQYVSEFARKDIPDSQRVTIVPKPPHVCMLCLRKFPSGEKLQRHELRSILHKQNLKTSQMHSSSRSSTHNSDQRPVPVTPPTSSPPVEAPIPASSKGSQLLLKMGWIHGAGAGARAQGITTPLNAVAIGGRGANKKTGLGSSNAISSTSTFSKPPS